MVDQRVERFLHLFVRCEFGRQAVEKHVLLSLEDVDQLLLIIRLKQKLAVTHRDRRVLLPER